ncbi:hypothetical protein C8Q77DRAFT_306118 [Trametes polyzona]|nr:hypothetical protein C8Q77DRAFT_306118 [Trametes polyzona]
MSRSNRVQSGVWGARMMSSSSLRSSLWCTTTREFTVWAASASSVVRLGSKRSSHHAHGERGRGLSDRELLERARRMGICVGDTQRQDRSPVAMILSRGTSSPSLPPMKVSTTVAATSSGILTGGSGSRERLPRVPAMSPLSCTRAKTLLYFGRRLSTAPSCSSRVALALRYTILSICPRSSACIAMIASRGGRQVSSPEHLGAWFLAVKRNDPSECYGTALQQSVK